MARSRGCWRYSKIRVPTRARPLAGIIQRYRVEGPGVLRPHKDRFRKLLTDRDPGLRKVAAWSLGADR
ncbi:MAG: hypothetical protein U0794_14915 [Isosphaeraceae bacterium]